jgi:hypothetical protein
MRVSRVVIGVIGLLVFAGAAGAALIPDQNSTISTSASNGWIVVAHQATITVNAYNTTNQSAVQGAAVSWALNTSMLGTLTSIGSTTNAFGQANTIFIAGHTSGSVNVTATITYNGHTVQKTATINIDHDSPYYAAFNYQTYVTVATITPFDVTFTDQWGNPIDPRNPYNPQFINLQVGLPTNTAAFSVNGTFPKSLTLQPDMNGSISVNVLTDSVGGENIIELYFSNYKSNGDVINGLPIDMEDIIGLTNGVPYAITYAVTPPDPLQADGASDHLFTFIFSLKDRFGNPAANQTVLIHSSFGDPDQYVWTNSQGNLAFNYGPHTTAGNVTITATATANTSVTCNDTVNFYSGKAVNMLFSADPATMPSLDADATSTSTLSAKIMDVMGNPVAGQSVDFNITPPIYDTPYNSTMPYLEQSTASSDSNGYATVTFIPGGFNTSDNTYGLFSATATGTTTAIATWNGVSQKVTLTWKNYPYLKVTTSVSPSVIPINGTVNVTISLLGDGYKLDHKPIDAVIVTDLAGGIGGTGLLQETQDADNYFIQNANNTTWVGLVSFGDNPHMYSADAYNLYLDQENVSYPNNHALFEPYTGFTDWCLENPTLWNTPRYPSDILVPDYENYIPLMSPWTYSSPYEDCPSSWGYFNSYSDASIDYPSLVDHQSELNRGTPLEKTVSNYNDVGGTDYAAGINAAVQLLANNPFPLHSHYIIIMGDGIPMMAPIKPNSTESYWPSDWYPRWNLGWEDESNTSITAAIVAGQQAIANGITLYAVGYPINGQVDKNTLKAIVQNQSNYYDGNDDNLQEMMKLIEDAIQAPAGVDTQMTLMFKNLSIAYDGTTQPFEYVYSPDSPPNNSTGEGWQDGTINTTDQTTDWNENHQLSFNVGTMYLGDQWNASFTLKATEQGIWSPCGNNSVLEFNDGADSENISCNSVTVVSNLTNVGVSNLEINITNLNVTQPAPYTSSIPLKWNISYPGNQTAQEIIWYSTDNSHWILGSSWSIMNTNGNLTETRSLPVSDLPSGNYYIMVQASAPDANCNSDLCPVELTTPISLGNVVQKAYIKLQ